MNSTAFNVEQTICAFTYLCPQQVSFPGMEVAAPQRHPLMAVLAEDTFTSVLTDPFLMTTEGGDGALVATGGVGGVLAAEEGYCDTLTGTLSKSQTAFNLKS